MSPKQQSGKPVPPSGGSGARYKKRRKKKQPRDYSHIDDLKSFETELTMLGEEIKYHAAHYAMRIARILKTYKGAK